MPQKWEIQIFVNLKGAPKSKDWIIFVKSSLTGVIILQTQPKHYYREIHQNYHTFALFDPPKNG